MAFGHPADHLQIAQPPRTFLDIRFQIIGSVVKFMAAFLLFLLFGFEERAVRPNAVGPRQRAHLLEQRGGTNQPPGLHQTGSHGNVGGSFLDAIFEGAHALAYFQADVPEKREKFLQPLAALGIGVIGREHHDVYVRGGM